MYTTRATYVHKLTKMKCKFIYHCQFKKNKRIQTLCTYTKKKQGMKTRCKQCATYIYFVKLHMCNVDVSNFIMDYFEWVTCAILSSLYVYTYKQKHITQAFNRLESPAKGINKQVLFTNYISCEDFFLIVIIHFIIFVNLIHVVKNDIIHNL